MPRLLTNDYQGTDILSNADIQRALTGDFEGYKFFFENCMLLQDRDTRQWVHPRMNKGQEIIAKTIFKHIDPRTRGDSHTEALIVSCRQIGKSTGLTSISNYTEAYVPGMENLNLVHTLQQGAAATKYFDQKLQPIVTGVNSAVFPTIEKKRIGTPTQISRH